MPPLYEHLSSPNSIRVFSLCPVEEWEQDHILQCEMRTVERTEVHEEYDALSYAWGNANDKDNIQVNGIFLEVPSSLVLMLKRIRYSTYIHKRPTFWADAICINQDDLDERSAQVRQMKSIFEDARAILAWLGPEADDSDSGMRLIESLSALHDEELENGGDDIDAVVSNIISMVAAMEDLNATKQESFWIAATALLRLLGRLWWRRTWIMQEATTSRPTHFICGGQAVPSRKAYRAISFVNLLVIQLNHIAKEHLDRAKIRTKEVGDIFRLMEFAIARKDHATSSELSAALDGLESFRTTVASDARDKVFAPLRIFSNGPFKQQFIDYRSPVEEVYIQFAAGCMQSRQPADLQVLGHCYIHTHALDRLDLPSWVPDWRYGGQQVPLRKRLSDLPGEVIPAYSADSGLLGHNPKDNEADLSAQVDGRLLHVSGLFIDSLALLGAVRDPDEMISEETFQAGLFKPDSVYVITSESMQKVFLHTIVADIVNDQPDQTYRRGGRMSNRSLCTGERDLFRESSGLEARGDGSWSDGTPSDQSPGNEAQSRGVRSVGNHNENRSEEGLNEEEQSVEDQSDEDHNEDRSNEDLHEEEQSVEDQSDEEQSMQAASEEALDEEPLGRFPIKDSSDSEDPVQHSLESETKAYLRHRRNEITRATRRDVAMSLSADADLQAVLGELHPEEAIFIEMSLVETQMAKLRSDMEREKRERREWTFKHRLLTTRAKDTIFYRRLVWTENGLFGLVASHAQQGDLLYAIYGGQVLYLLRKIENENAYTFIGECYIHGLMDGKAVEFVRSQGRKATLEEIIIK